MLTKTDLLTFYKKIFLIRSTELRISKEYSDNQIRCPVHLSIGQEAPAAAVNLFLKKSDFAISYHRAHAHYLAKDCSLNKMIAEIYGKKSGCSLGIGGSMHLIDLKKNFLGSTAIVSNSIPVGVGYAYSLLYKKQKSRVCIYIGDASCEEGVFYESLNFAILKQLPIIFFCENNKYSVYSNLNVRQPANRKLYKVASSFGIKSFYLSSAEPIKMLRDLKKILAKKNNPIFIEIDTYRHFEHCGPNKDDYLNYRPKSELNYWMKRDPLILTENFLLKKGIVNLDMIYKIKEEIKRKIDRAFIFAKKSKPLSYKEYLRLANISYDKKY